MWWFWQQFVLEQNCFDLASEKVSPLKETKLLPKIIYLDISFFL